MMLDNGISVLENALQMINSSDEIVDSKSAERLLRVSEMLKHIAEGRALNNSELTELERTSVTEVQASLAAVRVRGPKTNGRTVSSLRAGKQTRETVVIAKRTFEPATRKGSTSAIDKSAMEAEKSWAIEQEKKTQSMVLGAKTKGRKPSASLQARPAATDATVNDTKVIPMNVPRPDARVHKKESFGNKMRSNLGLVKPVEEANQWNAHRKASSKQLSKEEFAAAKKAFTALDTNGDGTLSPEELFSVLSCMGIVPSGQEMHGLLTEFDQNGDGSIGFEEFVHMMINVRERTNKNKVLSQRKEGGALFRMPRFASRRGSQQLYAQRQKPLVERLSSVTELVSKVHQFSARRDVIGNSPWILSPDDPVEGIWDMFITILLSITLLTMPLSMAFEQWNDQTAAMNLMIDACFLLDVVKNLNSGFVNDDEVVILDRNIIVRKYLMSWFLPDLLSSIPFDWILPSEGSAGDENYARTTKTMKLLRLIRLAKLLRLLRVNRVFKNVRVAFQFLADKVQFQYTFGHSVGRLSKWLFMVILAAHWIGCLNFMLCRIWEYPEDSWVVRSQLNGPNVSIGTQWSWCFFKALMLLISIGFQEPPLMMSHCMAIDDSGQVSEWCQIESWTTLLFLYVGCFFYAILISEVSSIVIQLNRIRNAYESRLQNANEYMSAKKLPYEIRDKVRDYLYMQFERGMLYDETEILRQLPASIRRDILNHNSSELVRIVPVLNSAEKDESSQFTSQMAACIKPTVAFAQEVIFEENTTGEEMYFIYSGVVEIVSKHYHRNKGIVTAIGNGCYFGDVALFYDVKRTAGTRANTLCVLFMVTKDDLSKCADSHKELGYMKMVAKYRMLRMKQVRETGRLWSNKEGDVKQGTTMDISPAQFASNMLTDPEDSKTEMLLVSSMLGKYERYVMNRSNGQTPPIYLQKFKEAAISDHVKDQTVSSSVEEEQSQDDLGDVLTGAASANAVGAREKMADGNRVTGKDLWVKSRQIIAAKKAMRARNLAGIVHAARIQNENSLESAEAEAMGITADESPTPSGLPKDEAEAKERVDI